jgi:hypothetical protein
MGTGLEEACYKKSTTIIWVHMEGNTKSGPYYYT